MTRFWRAALVAALAVAAGRSGGVPGPGVAAFSPTGSVERVEQVRLAFRTPMVPFGEPSAAAPVTGNCPGNGRWLDVSTYVIDYAAPVPGGRRCAFALTAGRRDAAGAALAPARFGFDTGGPALRAVAPQYDALDEQQIFLLALNAAPAAATLARRAECLIDGVGEAVPLDLQPDTVRDALLKAADDDWRVRNFLTEAGWRRPDYDGAETPPRAVVTAAKCRRTLPAGGKVSLRWAAGIATADGLATTADRRLDFSVRPAFSARFECSRANAAAACSPLAAMRVSFTGQVARDVAARARLVAADGKAFAPTPFKDRSPFIDRVEFAGPLPESMTFRVELPAGLKDDAGRPLANAARYPLDVATAEAPPLVKFAGPFGIVEAAAGGVLPVTLRGVESPLGGRALPAIGGRAAVIDSDRKVAEWLRMLTDAEDYASVQEPIAGTRDTRTINTTRATPLLDRGTPLRIAKREDARVLEVVGIPLRTKGFHVVELASPRLGAALLSKRGTRYVAAGALVTDMGVHFQWGRGASLAWVTRLADARPVAGARVAVSNSCTGAPLWSGVTDAQGRARIAGLPDPEGYGSCRYGPAPLMVSARAGDDFSFTMTIWNDGIQPGDFNLDTGYGVARTAWHTVFDRTLLKSGETLGMKHIGRTRTDAGFARVAAKQDAVLTIRHLGSDETYELPLAIGADGIGENRWTVPAAAALGDYQVELPGPGADERIVSGRFSVEAFRLPTIRAVVSGPKAPAIAPSAVPVDLALTYLSGGAVGAAPVKLRTRVETRSVSVAGFDGWTFDGEPVKAGIEPMGDGDETPGGPLRSTVEPVTLRADGTARVTVGGIGPVTRPSRLVAEMDYDDANGEISTASARIDLEPAALRVGLRAEGRISKADELRLKLAVVDLAGRPVKGAPVAVAVFSRETSSYRKRLIGGFYAYDNSRETKLLDAACAGRSDGNGRLDCRLAPGVSGEVIVQATARDGGGRTARAVTSVWLAGDDDWWFGGDNGDRMDLIADAPEYPANGVARLQVRMPFRAATALVSVLRDGVLDSYVTTLSGKSPVVEVKLKGAYAPDVYVSVLAVRGRVAGWRLWLADLARRWNLPWISRDAASPTALVDLAKPAYRLGMVRLKVGWDAHRLGVTVATDRPVYRVKQVARAVVKVSAPAGRTLPAGSEIAFAAVDEALLELKANDSWDVLAAMMAERPLSVLTSTAQTQVVGKRHYGRKAVAAGGGGGELGGARRDFQPLLLWRGRVALDARGEAALAVPLNDALSSFRLVAVATGGAELFGTGAATIRTTQDLQLLPGIPPLVRTGDRYVATVVARNATAAAMRVTLRATAGSAALPPQTIEIAAGRAATVGWTLTAPGAAGLLAWSIDAAAGSARDAVRVTQAVLPAVPVTVLQATLLQLDAPSATPVALPAGAISGSGGIELSLARTLGGDLPGVRAWAAAYPYNCIEQQLSRAVATGDRAAWDASVNALPGYLDRDGLLKFFPGDWVEGDAPLTAYALDLSARRGWPIPEASRRRMLGALTTALGRAGDDTDAPWKLAALAALAAHGAATPGLAAPIAVAPDRWATVNVIDWLETLQALPGVPERDVKLRQATQVLRARLAMQGTRLDIARSADAGSYLMSDDAVAARLVWLAATAPDWRADAGRLARGLMLRQRAGHWDTTTANALGTLAMARFAQRFEAATVTGATTATLGGASRALDWPAAGSPAPVALPWPGTPARLALRHAGTGAPWATLTARAAVPLTRPLSAGFSVSRTVTAVSRAVPGRWSRGDVLRVRIEFTPQAPLEWVVVNDPIPAGATILGGSLGGRATGLAGDEGGSTPTFVERRADAAHAYFASVGRAATAYEYTLRLNSAGMFSLPPTRVEALYAPEMFAALPNAAMTVAAK